MSAGSGKAVDPGHRGDLDKEIFMAWGKLVFGEPWRPEKEPPPDAKEIARILRLGLPVPTFVQDWLADLIDPPLEGGEEVKFALKRNGRAVQKLKWRGYVSNRVTSSRRDRRRAESPSMASTICRAAGPEHGRGK